MEPCRLRISIYGKRILQKPVRRLTRMKDRLIPVTSIASKSDQKVTPDLHCFPIQVVNVCFYGDSRYPHDWVLIDAGMPKSADDIISAAKEIYGEDNRPRAIILTHGHFDHVGALEDLLEVWDVPVYAHKLELPYLTGSADYPKPDPDAGGGAITKMSPMFPNQGIDIRNHVEALPADGSVPHMPGWEWIHTPGHTDGHVSLFRELDRTLIAGDAFVTVKQESLFKVMTQKPEISGPPKYLTTKWGKARESVTKLNQLNPTLAVTGHGLPMSGEELREGLERLDLHFEKLAIPQRGKYVDDNWDNREGGY